MIISKRLKFIASFVKKGMIIADIGADHGLLSYYLLSNNLVDKIYACDNKIGPFNNLKRTFNNTNFNIEIALKNGLTDLPSYVNTILIAGMGGELIIKILEEGKKYLSNIETLILSPHLDITNVRKYLYENNFYIDDEDVVFDDKYYHVIVAKKGDGNIDQRQCVLGPVLMNKKSPIIMDYYKEKIDELNDILSIDNLNVNKRKQLNELLQIYKEVYR